MKRIYFRNRELTICSKDNSLLQNNEAVILSPSNDFELANIPQMMEMNTNLNHLIVCENNLYSQEDIYRKITSNLHIINAGGGLISNSDGKFLMIYRRGVWDLPKGKQEEGEDIKDTAIRETAEEVGLECDLGDLICVTEHIYRIEKSLILKKTYWFSMYYSGEKIPVPQTVEQIEKCVWCTPEEAAFNLRNSYSAVQQVFMCANVI